MPYDALTQIESVRNQHKFCGRTAQMKYVYTVWLKDPALPDCDQDAEWPACVVIVGENQKAAKNWGDSIFSKYAQKTGLEFLSSFIEDVSSTLPGIDLLEVTEVGDMGGLKRMWTWW